MTSDGSIAAIPYHSMDWKVIHTYNLTQQITFFKETKVMIQTLYPLQIANLVASKIKKAIDNRIKVKYC